MGFLQKNTKELGMKSTTVVVSVWLLWAGIVWGQGATLAPLELQAIDLQFATGGLGQTSVQDRNDLGDVLLGSTSALGFTLLRTRDGTETRIECPAPALFTLAQAVNIRRQVVGTCVGPFGVSTGFLRLPQSGALLRLQAPGATQTNAYGINDRLHVVGDYRVGSGPTHGFRWQQDRFTTVDAPGDDVTVTTLLALNNTDVAAGYSVDSAGVGQGFLVRGGTFTPLNVPGATDTVPLDLNDNDEVVGVFLTPEGRIQSFFFDGTTYFAVAAPYPEIVQTEISALTTTGVMSGRILIPTNFTDDSAPIASRGLIARGLTLTPLTEPPATSSARAAVTRVAATPDPQRWCGPQAPATLRHHHALCRTPE
jgi:hypothetical protein